MEQSVFLPEEVGEEVDALEGQEVEEVERH